MNKQNKTTAGWEKEFDENFADEYCCNGDYCTGDHTRDAIKKTKDFIRNLLQESREELVKEFWGWVKERENLGWEDITISYIYDYLSKLTEYKK